MKTALFDYDLPQHCVAQRPAEPRDHAKLMIVDRRRRTRAHGHFYDILNYVREGDVLVWNNSKVFKARLRGKLVSNKEELLKEHKRTMEVFLVRPAENPGVWKVLARPGKHARIGTKIMFAEDFFCEVLAKSADGTILVQFPDSAEDVRRKANLYGEVPLPPYIKDEKHELEAYQTCYASDEKEGSVAAPTAGFHFTPSLIDRLKRQGIIFAEITLHVGLGTFLPVKSERIEDHTMHSEWAELSDENARIINTAKDEGRRVIGVGTTAVRTLEGIGRLAGYHDQRFEPYSGDIDIFITPGFEFKVVDALLTNFHLPKSTLLMLVSAFVGDLRFVLECYEEAVRQDYRFYSFGDAMFIE